MIVHVNFEVFHRYATLNGIHGAESGIHFD